MTEFHTTVREGKESDWLYIDSLRKKNGSALGFIPKNAYLGVLGNVPADGRHRYRYSKIYVIEDNGDLTGFCYVSFREQYAHVFQLVVQEDARRWYRATLLEQSIEHYAKHTARDGIECRVAVDLESNFYWRAMGYEPIKQVVSTWLNQKESKSKRPLWHYKKSFGNLPLFEKVSI